MAATTRRAEEDRAATATEPPALNEVRLHGRVAAAPEERGLPSGDTVVTLRLVVRRDDAAGGRRRAEGSTTRATVDTIDVACWSAGPRRAALRLSAGDHVEVLGSLRRRFFGKPGGARSRYEVEARAVRRLARAASRGASGGVAKGGAAPS